MSPVRVVGKIPDLSNVPRDISRKALRESVNILRKYARQEAPKRTGRLRSQMRTSVSPGKSEGRVRAAAPHAHLVHEGTRAHWIPKLGSRKRGVRVGGRWFRHVRHPGARKNPFMTRALGRGQPEVDRIMDSIGDAVLAQAAR